MAAPKPKPQVEPAPRGQPEQPKPANDNIKPANDNLRPNLLAVVLNLMRFGTKGSIIAGIAWPDQTASKDQDQSRQPLYRAISVGEYNHLLKYGNYGFNPTGMEGKYFSPTLEGAQNVANSPVMGNPIVTMTTVPPSVYEAGYVHPDPNLAGTSIFYNNAQLPMVYGSMTPVVVLSGAPK